MGIELESLWEKFRFIDFVLEEILMESFVKGAEPLKIFELKGFLMEFSLKGHEYRQNLI